MKFALFKNSLLLSSKQIIINSSFHRDTSKLFNNLYESIARNLKSMQPKNDMSHVQNVPEHQGSDKIFVQHNPVKDEITISFEYNFKGRHKHFNMNRKATEPLISSIERIKLNIVKLDKRRGRGKIENEESLEVDDVSLSINGSLLDPQKVKNMDAWIEGAVLSLGGKAYEVKANQPIVESIKLPSCIMSNFPTMPYVKLINCETKDCKFSWFRRITSKEHDEMIAQGLDEKQVTFDRQSHWLKVSDDLIFRPTQEDVAHMLKFVCVPFAGVKEGIEARSFSNRLVELGPMHCPFIKRHSLTKNQLNQPDEFRFVSYNILADLYVDQEYSREVLFAHCPTYALELEYRRQLLMKELLGYNADLICLQEVDKKEFIRTYEPFFKLAANSSGTFFTKGGQVAEGLATFYRDDKFELVDSHKTLLTDLIEPSSKEDVIGLEYTTRTDSCLVQQQSSETERSTIFRDKDTSEAKNLLPYFDDIRSAIKSNENLWRRFMGRSTILHITLLKSKGFSNKFLLVANTHLYFAPDADHIRLLQGCICVKYIESIKEFYKSMLMTRYSILHPEIGVIFCGDMNSTPDSGIYKLVTQGRADRDLPDWSSNMEEIVKNLDFQNNLQLSSAYENVEYTNYTPGFKGCLDYIYYDQNNLACTSIIPLPEHKDVIITGGIPSDVFPSDHLALIANLKYSRK